MSLQIAFDDGRRRPQELRRLQDAANRAKTALAEFTGYPKPHRDPFEAEMLRGAKGEVERLLAYLDARRDSLLDAATATERGRARLDALPGGRTPEAQ